MPATAKWYQPEDLNVDLAIGTVTTSRDVSGCDTLLVGIENVTGSRGTGVIALQGSLDDVNWVDIDSSITLEGRQLPADISSYAYVRFRVAGSNIGAWTVSISISATDESDGVTVTTADLNATNTYADSLFDCQDYNTLRVRGDLDEASAWGVAVVTFYSSTDGIEWTTTTKTLGAAGDITEIDVRNIRFIAAKVTTASGFTGTIILTAFASTDILVPDSVTSTPIGSIIAWAKTLTGVPAIPDGWVECDGTSLNDPASPLDGTTIPDLGSTFLRGSTTSGGTGGAATHTLTQAEMPAGVVMKSGGSDGATSGFGSWGVGGGGAHENLPPYYNVVWIMRTR